MSKIKECFTSRWVDGVLMQADFSQLEVVVLAYLSQDPQLMEDLKTGVDMHCLNAEFLYGIPYSTIMEQVKAGNSDMIKKRKIAKAPGFLIQYGGGASTMAKNTGLSVDQCRGFIAAYYDRYSGVEKFQNTVQDSVKASRGVIDKFVNGTQVGVGQYTTVTGRRYVFEEQEAPDFLKSKGYRLSFSPTQMKNYPVQGMATGDIVPLMLGKLNRVLADTYQDDLVLLINTIHDSVMLDIHPDVNVESVARQVKSVLENTPQIFEGTFDVAFNMPLKVDVEVGPTWADMEKLDI